MYLNSLINYTISFNLNGLLPNWQKIGKETVSTAAFGNTEVENKKFLNIQVQYCS